MSTTAEAERGAQQLGSDEPKAARTETEYLVLKQTDQPDAWAIIGEFTATGGKGAALKKYVDEIAPEDRAGAYKAVAKSAFAGGVKGAPREVIKTDFEEIA